jgi:hypothetical protein
MTTPTQAILWQILWRARWAWTAAGAYLLVAMTLSHLLTPLVRVHFGEDGVTALGLWVGAPCALIIILVIAAFSLSSTSSADTSPPSHMLVLPITTRTLVGVPMMAGSVAVAVVWLVIACLVLWPAGVSAPLLWPAAALIVFLVAFQAIAWTPFAQRWLQGLLTVAVFTGGFAVLLLAVTNPLARSIVTSESLAAAIVVAALAPLAYWAAFSGVTMARRGDAYDWQGWNRLMAWLAAWRKPAEHPFSSAVTAQVWFECRSWAWYVPLFVGGMVWVLPLILVIDRDDRGQTWKQLGLFLGMPIAIATMAGGSLGSLNGLTPKSRQAAFLFARPLTSAALVRGKLLMAAVSALSTWLVVLPIALLLLLFPTFRELIGELTANVPLWKVATIPLLTVLLLLALTWKQLVENFWITLTGRDWLMYVAIAAVMSLFFIGTGFGFWVFFHPDYQPAARAAVPWLMGLAALLKLLVAGTVLRALDRSQLLSRKSILMMFGMWCLVVLGLSSIALWRLPLDGVSAASIVTGIVLLIPFSRLAGAPLAVAWNRHR